jgi:DNA polymerase I-like protein with 3'-5' exonuclease and polymerase domains
MSFGFADGRTFYIPVRHAESIPHIEMVKAKTERGGTTRRRVVREGFIEREFEQLAPEAVRLAFGVIKRKGIRLICHNARFDVHMTEAEGVVFFDDDKPLTVYDTYLMSKLIDGRSRVNGLKKLAVKYVDKTANAEEEALKRTLRERGWVWQDADNPKRDIARYDWMTPAEMAPYAEKDAFLTFALYRIFHAKLATQKQLDIFKRETDLLPVITAMERRGMYVDLDYCRSALALAKARLAELTESIHALAGEEFDIGNVHQLGPILQRLGVSSPVKSKKTGKDSWAKDVLALSDAPIVRLVEEWRGLEKMRTTYLINYLRFADADGLIHADVQQCEAVTGRTSSRDPNLQNVTRDERHGIALRRVFRPRPGYVWVLIDWSQIEARIVADWAGEESLLDVIRSGGDIHALTAKRIAEVTGTDCCGDKACKAFSRQRTAAKNVFFASLYGAGAAKLAAMIGISVDEASALRDAFWRAYPKIAEFARRIRNEAKRNGYIRNRYGRLYGYPLGEDPTTGKRDYLYTHAAVDHAIQGTAVDLAKETLIKVHRGLRKAGLDAGLIGFVHDELITECRPADVNRVARNIARIMTTPGDLFQVPIEVEVSVAVESWFDKRAYEKGVEIDVRPLAA